MANDEHVEIIRQGVSTWNQWRIDNAKINPALNGINLSKTNLRDANLSGANLRDANLSGANLVKASLREANLHKADLCQADLNRANLVNAKLNGATLNKAILNYADLSGADLSMSNLTKAKLNSAILIEARLSRADLNGAILSGARLSRADLNGAILNGAILNGAKLSQAHFNGAKLQGAKLSRADLTRAVLTWVDLSETILRETDFSDAILSGAILNGADLSGGILRRSILSGANLSGAILSEADFNSATLSWANLSETDLSKTDFSNANLDNVDFSEAILDGTIFVYTNLEGAILSRANLAKKDLRGVNLYRANLTDASLQAACLIEANLDRAILTGACLWETQRAEWSIKDIICDHIFWDEQAREITEYAEGEFERRFADRMKIKLFFQDGISSLEIATLPALIHHLEKKEIYRLRFRSIQEDSSGAIVELAIENNDNQSPEHIKQLQTELQIAANQQVELQRKFLSEEKQRLQDRYDELRWCFEQSLANQKNIIIISSDTYQFDRSIVAAAGPNAQARNTFPQLVNPMDPSIDLSALTKEFFELPSVIKDQKDSLLQTTITTGEMTETEIATIEKATMEIVKRLKTAGRWTLDFAKNSSKEVLKSIIKRRWNSHNVTGK
jgi:uncharacterized protein YjbI with pentapeptide repeats